MPYLIFTAIILGIVQGMTEFIPVSSTGHLILTGHLLGFTGAKAANFEVVIQLGSILAIVILYWQKLISMLNPKEILDFKKPQLNVWHIAIAMIPAVIVGLTFHEYIKQYLFSPGTVIIGLILGGIFMIFAEKLSKPQINNVDKVSYKQALVIGLIQCLSLWPGFSRSGATISGGMFSGLDRKSAAEFSFILAVPIMVAASGLDTVKIWNTLNSQDLFILSIGFVVSFAVAYGAVIFFLNFLNKHSLKSFAYYRFILAIAAYAYFF